MQSQAFLKTKGYRMERVIDMNVEMAYLTGMILGNGEIQRGVKETTITIDIPYKNLYTDDLKDVAVYVKASTVDM